MEYEYATSDKVNIAIVSAVLGTLEYRGFYDCGKYLDDDFIRELMPVIHKYFVPKEEVQNMIDKAVGEYIAYHGAPDL